VDWAEWFAVMVVIDEQMIGRPSRLAQEAEVQEMRERMRSGLG